MQKTALSVMKSGSLILILISTFSISDVFAQKTEFSTNSITVGAGVGSHQGHDTEGLGIVYSLGVQKKMLKNERLIFNPVLINGNFSSAMYMHSRDQYYRLTSAQFRTSYDILKGKKSALFIGSGAFLTYTRGLKGTGGEDGAISTSSNYFLYGYIGGLASAGLRIDNPNKRIAYEIAPINVQFTNKYVLYHWNFAISIKFNKSNN
jgi:hypothetical protein